MTNIAATNAQRVSTSSIEFDLFAYNSRCLLTDLNDRTVNNMAYTMQYPVTGLDQVFGKFTDTIEVSTGGAVDCGPRLYTLSNTGWDAGIVTVDAATHTLTILTDWAPFAGQSFTVDMEVELEDHPWLTLNLPLKLYKSFTFTVDSVCDTTTIVTNPDFLVDHLHMVG